MVFKISNLYGKWAFNNFLKFSHLLLKLPCLVPKKDHEKKIKKNDFLIFSFTIKN